MRHSCVAEVVIERPPDTVWAIVSDLDRVGEWSGECRRCTWVGGSSEPVAGARFRGRNHRAGLRWSRLNEIVVARAPWELIWRTLPSGPFPDSVEWRITLRREDAGTRVTESYRVVHIPRLMEWAISAFFPPHRDRTSDLRADLERLRAIVCAGGADDAR
ncbi:MAG: SRPBCC family protein [Acidimicrobiales bacterium]